MEEAGTVVVSGGPFNVTLLDGELVVLSIPAEFVPCAAWWLFREYVLKSDSNSGTAKRTSFSSLFMDDDGLSIVCHPSDLVLLESLQIKGLNVSPSRWRALEINIVGSATEFPGAVYFLADTLSKRNISILHISTFESEIFLVQEQDIDTACELLRGRTEEITDLNLVKLGSRAPTGYYPNSNIVLENVT